MSHPSEEESSPTRDPPGMRTLELRVPDMDCPSCAGKVTKGIERLEGIERVDPQVTTGRLVVEYDHAQVREATVRERVEATGYAVESTVCSGADEDGHESSASGSDHERDHDQDDEHGTGGDDRAFAVPEMDCASCATKVEHALEGVDGVEEIDTRPTSGRVVVRSEADLEPAAVVAAIANAGYEASPVDDESSGHRARAVWRTPRGIATAAGGTLAAAGVVLHFFVPAMDPHLLTIAGREFALSQVLFVLSAAIAGAPILRNGYYSARTRSLDIDFLMSAGIVASVATHHPFEGAMLAVLFSVAQLLERFSMDRARETVRELMILSPETATVRRDGEEVTVPASDVDVGETVVVRPGEKIPTDGVVREGESSVNQAPITGESVPVDVAPGDEVYGGTITEAGYLEVEATSEASHSTIAKIVDLVEDAERSKSDREQFVDSFANVYTPIMVALAIAVAVVPPLAVGASWNTWFLRGLTVLVVACPCAFVISTPVSVVSGITSAARHGVLIKGGRHLETIGESDVLAMDKTGTLTTGELSVTDVISLNGASEDDVLRRAGAIERRSEHPVGQAIVDEADGRGVLERGDASDETETSEETPVTDFEALTGRGVRADVAGVTHYVGKPDLFGDLTVDLSHVHASTDGGQILASAATQCEAGDCLDVLTEVVPALEAQGKTVVLVGTEDRVLGVVGVADEVRPEARWTVSQLRDRGVRVVMLTGDNEGTARAIADEVGIEEYRAELLPEEKLKEIRRLEERDRVAMVGDGINDAPALATATVGVAMGAAGTDTALETADVALLGDDLTRLPYLYRLSQTATGVIRQNVWSSLVVKGLLVAGAPFGIVTVIHAVVIGDMGMTLGVTGNAMRLSRVEPETPDVESGDSTDP